MPTHPIFDDIHLGNLEAVTQHVLADPAVLEEQDDVELMTPLIYAVFLRKPTIAHWLIEHRGQHDVNTQGHNQISALHLACSRAPLSVVEALVASGADPAVTGLRRFTPLMLASIRSHSDIVAYLLRLPAVRATINTANSYGRTALSYASVNGRASSVQLLLDAAADPTIPNGDESALNLALSQGHTATVALLRHIIAEADRTRALHKAWSLIDAPRAIAKAEQDGRGKGDAPAVQRHKAIAAAPVCLKGRVPRDEALPVPELAPQQGDERVRATVAFVLGLEEGGAEYAGLPQEVYVELLGYMLPAWADKGPEAVAEAVAEDEDEDDSESDDDDGSGSEIESEGSDTE